MRVDVAIFLPSLDGGGAEKVMLSLAGEFASRGLRCDVVIAISKGRLLGAVPASVRLVELGHSKALNATFSLAGYLRKHRPRALLSTVFSANLVALLSSLLSFSGVRVVTCEASPTNWDVQSKSRLGTLLNVLAARTLYPVADATITISQGVKASLLRYNRGSKTDVRVIPNPLPGGLMPRAPKEIKDRAPQLVVACGRLEPQKDYPTLLKAFARLRSQVSARLVILGEGTLRSELENQAKALGIDEHVRFEGFVLDPYPHMREASLFVHTASYEGFGVVLLEALACGCSIVATDSPGGVREVLQGGDFGVLVPVGDEGAIADAMRDVLLGRTVLKDPAEHLKKYSLNVIADQYLDLLLPNRAE